MTYNFTSNNYISLPKAVFERLHAASELDLRVLLVLANIMDDGNIADSAAIATALAVEETEVNTSLAFWRGAGVISVVPVGRDDPGAPSQKIETQQSGVPRSSRPTDSPPLIAEKRETPTYTGTEIEQLFTQKSSLRVLINECQNLTEKMFSPSEVSKVVALSDYLNLSDEYILLLFSHCKSKGKNSVSYAVKTAYNLASEGVGTYSELEEYIRGKEQVATLESQLRTLIGAQNRVLTSRERTYIKDWTAQGHDYETIAAAYETMVDSIGKVQLAYMNKILESNESAPVGRDNPGAPSKKSTPLPTGTSKKSKKLALSSFDTDEFFKAALEASQAKYKAE